MAEISKAEAVRAAIKANVDKPQEAVAWIKEKYGLDVSTQVFSSYKSNELKKDGGGEDKKAVSTPVVVKRTVAEPTPAPAPSPAKPPAQKPAATTNDGNSFDLGLAKQIKELVAVHGIEKVRELVNLFE